ncbi:hypothetical protein ARMSODRAFT_611464 [Armillaria solidipes]|uniref:Uncharacterized protein n=1 Tax=Armillaria solidipes TaxID=1076256 RepID=A0A2H3AZM1_9AGAR|nr:hypothetical protein ARMSODRAFT_611464 [Armillaria solidipes]
MHRFNCASSGDSSGSAEHLMSMATHMGCKHASVVLTALYHFMLSLVLLIEDSDISMLCFSSLNES